MKYIFEERDIKPGAFVMDNTRDYKSNATDHHKINRFRMISYIGGGMRNGSCMVCLTDGAIYLPGSTPKQIAEYLNRNNYAPAPHRHLIDALTAWRDVNEFLPEGR